MIRRARTDRQSLLRALAFLAFALAALSERAVEAGSITGTLDPEAKASSVFAVDRATDKKYPGTIDAATGRFTIEGLPAEASVDCLIDFPGARLEGISLKVPPSDYEEEQPLSVDDLETIRKQVKLLNKFEDEVEILAIAGNIQHAAVLLNKLRTRPFVNSKPGEIVWRAELWHFVRPEETWLKSPDELFLVLYRERIPEADYRRKSITFDPTLGGLTITTERPTIQLGAVRTPATKPGIRLAAPSEPIKP